MPTYNHRWPADRGEVAEWLMAPVLKTGVPERVSGVRIPPLPPLHGADARCSLAPALCLSRRDALTSHPRLRFAARQSLWRRVFSRNVYCREFAKLLAMPALLAVLCYSHFMATITIRNLDEKVKRALQVRAAQNGRSMEAEVRAFLT